MAFEKLVSQGKLCSIDGKFAVDIAVTPRLKPYVALLSAFGQPRRMPQGHYLPLRVDQAHPGGKRTSRFFIHDPDGNGSGRPDVLSGAQTQGRRTAKRNIAEKSAPVQRHSSTSMWPAKNLP